MKQKSFNHSMCSFLTFYLKHTPPLLIVTYDNAALLHLVQGGDLALLVGEEGHVIPAAREHSTQSQSIRVPHLHLLGPSFGFVSQCPQVRGQRSEETCFIKSRAFINNEDQD